MRGLDTNILLRFFTQDDPVQSRKADAIVASLTPENPGWVSIPALMELIWVASNGPGYDRVKVCALIEALFAIDNVVMENGDAVGHALNLYRRGNAGFADCLISSLGRAAGCSETLTFDKKAAKTAQMTLVS